MLPLLIGDGTRPLHLLCIGAHSDDIEIGCGATVRSLARRGLRPRVTWVVLSAAGERAAEARASAQGWLGAHADLEIHLAAFPDARFPVAFAELKDHLAMLRDTVAPDVIFTHSLDDRHQDHRTVAELTWQAWRDHLVLEYEIPKYEGDLGRPNFYMPIDSQTAADKVDHLMANFGSQRSKSWFSPETFRALMHLRGIECRAPQGFAEAFVARKVTL